MAFSLNNNQNYLHRCDFLLKFWCGKTRVHDDMQVVLLKRINDLLDSGKSQTMLCRTRLMLQRTVVELHGTLWLCRLGSVLLALAAFVDYFLLLHDLWNFVTSANKPLFSSIFWHILFLILTTWFQSVGRLVDIKRVTCHEQKEYHSNVEIHGQSDLTSIVELVFIFIIK